MIPPSLIKVAIVEDNREFRATLQSYLNEAPGYNCVSAHGSAEEALKIIPKLQPDVVLMDIHLPSMSGIECTRRLKELWPAARILVLTVYEDNERIFGALKAGASGYLLKRAAPAEVLRAIQEVKTGGAPMSSLIASRVVESFREPVRSPGEGGNLSQREAEVLQELAKGYRSKQIASRLFISVDTVNAHIRHVYDKLHVRSRTEAVLKFLKHPDNP